MVLVGRCRNSLAHHIHTKAPACACFEDHFLCCSHSNCLGQLAIFNTQISPVIESASPIDAPIETVIKGPWKMNPWFARHKISHLKLQH